MSSETQPPPDDALPEAGPESRGPRTVIFFATAIVAIMIVALFLLARSRTNHHALSDEPTPVTVVRAQAATYRPTRSYVGTTAAWNQASVGPQYVSAYVGTVLVRPGAVVKRGEVLATLDCRNASAASKEIAARARAVAERQVAASHESERLGEMKQGGFASANEVEQEVAHANAESAEVESLKATLISRSLEVDDCILRAPFAGEVAERLADPGAYVRPGSALVTIVDRSIVRVVVDAPESDFSIVAPQTPVAIEIAATGAHHAGTVARRSPAADENTRTVEFEIDLPNPAHEIPVGATARVSIDVGEAKPATLIPLRAAEVHGEKATIMTIAGGVAKREVVPLLGERSGALFLDAKLAAGTELVLEGRAFLNPGDHVAAKEVK